MRRHAMIKISQWRRDDVSNEEMSQRKEKRNETEISSLI